MIKYSFISLILQEVTRWSWHGIVSSFPHRQSQGFKIFLHSQSLLADLNMIDRRFLRILLVVIFACAVLPCLLFKLISSPSSAEEEREPSYDVSQKRNESSANISTSEIGLFISCRKPSLDDFPSDIMTQQQRQKGGVALHAVLAFYMVLAIAVACEDYFVPSLEQITDKLQMNSDIAGATFMAVGSSAPEFFTGIIGAFITRSDIGLDTIVGSCTYNILFVVAVCGLFASGSALRMSRWSLLRDSLCYLLSIAVLVVVCYDKKVYWYEALVMVCMYLLYTAFMYFNQPLQNYFHRIGRSDGESVLTSDTASSEKNGLLPKEDDSSRSFSIAIQYSQEVKETDENNPSPFSFPQGTISRALWIIALPIKCLFFLTIPNCRKARWENWYLVSFTVSLIWIASFTYGLVWMVTIIGFTAGIPTVIFAFTLLAAGCSAPECLSSAIVTRKGYGDMAVAQTLGSNVFDILICLGLPWFLRTVVEGDHVNVVSGSIFYGALCLFGTVILLILCLILSKWYLNKFLAVMLFSFYLCYVSIATLFGLNVLGDLNQPTCRH